MKGVNPQGTYRHRVPTLTLMGLALHGPAWAGGPHTHTPTVGIHACTRLGTLEPGSVEPG
jgi:hypothetical protein